MIGVFTEKKTNSVNCNNISKRNARFISIIQRFVVVVCVVIGTVYTTFRKNHGQNFSEILKIWTFLCLKPGL